MEVPRQKSQSGFTLIELLVVISIIALLVAMLLPALSQAREAGRKVLCLANVKQITLGMFGYHDDNRDIMMRTGYNGAMRQGDHGRLGDFYNFYRDYLTGSSLAPMSGSLGGPNGNTQYSEGVRFNTAKVFICPSRVRTGNSAIGPYNYFRLPYAIWPGSANNFTLKFDALRRAGTVTRGSGASGSPIPGKIPAMVSDRCNRFSGGGNGDVAETNHWNAGVGVPEGGHVGRADGSAMWYRYSEDPFVGNAFIVPWGGYSGGQTAIPSDAIYSNSNQYDFHPNRVIMGRGSLDDISKAFGYGLN